MSVTRYPVFTVGHSNHSPETFIQLLLRHGVAEVVDVRSTPYSRYISHFNSESLNRILDEMGIEYAFLGRELGGRPSDRSCYDAKGRVRYDRVANTALFDDGLKRVMRGANERRIALMCTEKEPLECHRTLLVARILSERGVAVEHILADGRIENHSVAMDRLLDMFKLPHDGDMFTSRTEVIADALTRQAQKVAYIDGKSKAGADRRESVF